MSYTPSEAAVEVLKIERARHSESVVDAIAIGACACGWILDLLRFNDHIASAMLVALMGATVPCATCRGTRKVYPPSMGMVALDTVPGYDPRVKCPDCDPPRSLVVRECEQAGRLEPIECYLATANGNSCGEPLFREVPPTEETR